MLGVLTALAMLGAPLRAVAPLPAPPQGTEDAVRDLLARVLPEAIPHISLGFGDCGSAKPCFRIQGGDSPGTVTITASSASELASGLGFYLRELCNVTIGWPRGGGSRLVAP